jgi:hypothetical protein
VLLRNRRRGEHHDSGLVVAPALIVGGEHPSKHRADVAEAAFPQHRRATHKRSDGVRRILRLGLDKF